MVLFVLVTALLCISNTLCYNNWCYSGHMIQKNPCCETGIAFADLSNDPDAQDVSNTASNIEILQEPTAQNDGPGEDCSKSALFKITFDKLTNTPCTYWSHYALCNRRMLRIEIQLKPGNRSDWAFSLADSITNDGEKGDDGTQENDAAIVGKYPDIKMYLSDKAPNPAGAFYTFSNAIGPNVNRVFMYVSNQYIRIMNDQFYDYYYWHTYLFALNNFPDNQGPMNQDLYLGINRMVSNNTSKTGYGICSVKLSWLCPCNDHCYP